MERKFVKLGVVAHLDPKKGFYLEVSPAQKEVPYPYNLRERFTVPVDTRLVVFEGAYGCMDAGLSHSLDYSRAVTASGASVQEIMDARPVVEEVLSSLEQGLILAAQISLDGKKSRGNKILVEYPIDRDFESRQESRRGKPPRYDDRSFVRRVKAVAAQ